MIHCLYNSRSMRKIPQILFAYLCLAIVVVGVSLSCPVMAQTASTTIQTEPSVIQSPDDLANRILKCELELETLNQLVHLKAANPSFCRKRRTWLWDMGNGLPTEGGLIAATALFFGHTKDKLVQTLQFKFEGGVFKAEPTLKIERNRIPDSKIAGTIFPQIVGQVIGGTGSYFELGVDWSNARRLHMEKLDNVAATARAVSLKQQIDELLTQFERQALDASSGQTMLTEAKILRHIRNRALNQFTKMEGAGSNNLVGRIIEDAASATRNTVGTVGNTINVAAIMRNNKRLNGDGAILNMISASIITARPVMSNAGSYWARRLSKKHARENFNDAGQSLANSELIAEIAQLRAECNLTPTGVSLHGRLAFYDRQSKQFAEDDDLALADEKSAKQTAVRRYRESIYGPTKLAQSVIGAVVDFRKQGNATSDNRLGAGANVTYCSGQGANILELLRERVVDESDHKRLRTSEMLPEQRIERSLKELESMKTSLIIQ